MIIFPLNRVEKSGKLAFLSVSTLQKRIIAVARVKKPEIVHDVKPILTDVRDVIVGLQLEELVILKSDVELLIGQKQKEKKKELYADMLELAHAAGFKSVEELVSSQKGRRTRSDKGVRFPPKYHNPQDTKKTWSGKGRKPNWVNKHIEGGGQLEELEID